MTPEADQPVDPNGQVDFEGLSPLKVQSVSAAAQRQAFRSGEIRKRLLESEGAAIYETLASMRGSDEKAARQWVSRQCQEQRLFTVEAQGRALVPDFQLNDGGGLDKAVTGTIIRPLLKAGVRPWTIWAWSTRPTGLLSGRVPAKLVHEEPAVVQEPVNVHIEDLDFPAGA